MNHTQARSQSSSTTGALTPTSSRADSPHSPHGLPSSPRRDSPLPSVEQGIETLEVSDAHVAVSSPPVYDGSSLSISGRLDELQLNRRTSVTTPSNGRASLSPGSQNYSPSRPGSSPRASRRTSSRNNVQRHEVEQEELPDSIFYSHNFQDALTRSRAIASQLADALSSCELHTDENSDIFNLHTLATHARHYHGPSNWKIGLVGDSGAGSCDPDVMVINIRS